MNLSQWNKLEPLQPAVLFLFLLECNINHCVSTTNPVHFATQSFPMTGLRGMFESTVHGLGTQWCTVVLLVRATGDLPLNSPSADDMIEML